MDKKNRLAIKYRSTTCLNCEHELDLSDKYCPSCSQRNSAKKLSIKDFFSELFSNIFSYDSKLRKTLTAMLFRPGRITKAYLAGKRKSYTNPFRFFLSLAIVYFLMLNYFNNFEALDRFGADNKEDSFAIKEDGIFNWKFTPKEDKNNAIINDTIIDELNVINIDSIQRDRIRKDSMRIQQPMVYFDSIQNEGLLTRISLKVNLFQSGIRKRRVRSYEEAVDSLKVRDTYENKLSFSAAKSLTKAINKPGSYLSFVISKLPFIIFLFLPLFAVFIWLIYSKKKYGYADHLIFSFHTQTMLIILMIMSFALDRIFKTSTLSLWALLLFIFYLYKAMRNFYGQGRLKTIVKFMFLNSIFFILANVILIFFFIISVFTY